MASSTWTVSCDQHLYRLPKHLHRPQRKSRTCYTPAPISPSPQSLATTPLLPSLPICLFRMFYINGISTHTAWDPVWPVSFTSHDAFEVHLRQGNSRDLVKNCFFLLLFFTRTHTVALHTPYRTDNVCFNNGSSQHNR